MAPVFIFTNIFKKIVTIFLKIYTSRDFYGTMIRPSIEIFAEENHGFFIAG